MIHPLEDNSCSPGNSAIHAAYAVASEESVAFRNCLATRLVFQVVMQEKTSMKIICINFRIWNKNIPQGKKFKPSTLMFLAYSLITILILQWYIAILIT